ncbi:hypothetical protein BuS5_00043 [Desulfosarcina sp. BuS5]|uniref:PHP domain-containing protein n=1 Tax=Desulfosarcina sp. BuS5 TaxID=933262 RepID=UPI00068786FF|nr:PHP domain-containing protein [Desulfosarcina sp. BuS5]WDN87075.1 hypothetical protein BuS5_00043 [Desulfosarcina sp. BuS5]
MKFDLHIHSKYSYDSLSSVDAIIKHARQEGLNGIAITDHNSFDAAFEISSQNDNFWVIFGSEIHTEVGDIIGLFISRPLTKHNAVDLIKEIHDQDGIAILAHPFKRMKQYPKNVIDMLDAIEIVNSRWVNLKNYDKKSKTAMLLSTVRGRSAGSDAHFLFEIGRAYLVTPKLSSPCELKKIIREGTGQIHSKIFSSSWLDEASQVVNFIKTPSIYQFGRILFRILRRLLKGKQNRIFDEDAK